MTTNTLSLEFSSTRNELNQCVISADCHATATGWQDRQKLSASGLSNPMRTNTGRSGNKTTDAELLMEVENQLMQNGGNWNYSELKSSFQKYFDKGSRTGLTDNKEVHFICFKYV